MNRKFKIISIDVDGTLTTPEGRPHREALQTIREAEKQGITIILVSGRPMSFLDQFLEENDLCISGPLIAENGGILKMHMYAEPLPPLGDPNIAKEAFNIISSRLKNVRKTKDCKDRQVDIAIELGVDESELRKVVADIKNVQLTKSSLMLHIMDRRTDKGVALRKVLDLLNASPLEVIAIGDAENDLPMFDVVGYRIAVANATEKIKKEADFVTSKRYGRGAAEAIRMVIEKIRK